MFKNLLKLLLLNFIISPSIALLSPKLASAQEIVYTNKREVSVPIDKKASSIYLFEGEPNFNKLYNISEIKGYTDNWTQHPAYANEHPLLKHCRDNWYWISGEYIHEVSNPKLKYRRALVNFSTGERISYDGKIPITILDAACDADSIVVIGMNMDRGTAYRINENHITDLTPKFTQISYTHRLMDIDYNREYFLIASRYGIIYKLTKNNEVRKVSAYSTGWAVNNVEWIDNRNRWLISPLESELKTGWYNPNNNSTEKLTDTPGYEIIYSNSRIFLKGNQSGISSFSIFQNGKEKTYTAPEEFKGKNSYGRYWRISGAEWNGKFWIIYFTDSYDITKLYAFHNEKFYYITEFSEGLDYLVQPEPYLSGWNSRIFKRSFNRENGNNGKFTLSDKEGTHTVTQWSYKGESIEEKKFSYIYDKTAPPKVEAKVENEDICTDKYIVKWSEVKDNLSNVEYELKLNGDLFAKTADTSIAIESNKLNDNLNSVEITSFDQADNKSEATTVEFSKLKPNLKLIFINDIEVSNPEEEYKTEENSITLKGTAAPNSKISIEIEKIPDFEKAVIESNAEGEWSWKFPGTLMNENYFVEITGECDLEKEKINFTYKIEGDEKTETVIEEKDFDDEFDSKRDQDENKRLNINWSIIFIVVGIILLLMLLLTYILYKRGIIKYNKKVQK